MPARAIASTLSQFGIDGLDSDTPSATVSLTADVKTYLMGVQGHPETDPITTAVTATPDMLGGQFWIKYVPDVCYVAANEGTWHVDFNAAMADGPAQLVDEVTAQRSDVEAAAVRPRCPRADPTRHNSTPLLTRRPPRSVDEPVHRPR